MSTTMEDLIKARDTAWFIEHVTHNIKEMIAAQDMAALMEESHKEFNRLRRAMGLPEIRPDADITDEALTIETAFGKPVKIL